MLLRDLSHKFRLLAMGQNGVNKIWYLWPMTFLIGCAWLGSQPFENEFSPAKPDMATNHVEEIAALTHWSFNGKLALKKASEGLSARVSWYQRENDYSVKFKTLLLGEVISIEKSGSLFSVFEGQRTRYEAESAEGFIKERFGSHFPESSIPFWVRGIPDPIADLSNEELDAKGRYRVFSQLGWQVTIIGYTGSSNAALPRRLKIENSALSLSIVVHEWRVY